MSDGGAEINSLRDVGTQALFSGDRDFRRADFFPADESDINPNQINKIRKFFEEEFNLKLERDMGAIADAVETHFHSLNRQATEVLTQLQQMKLPTPVVIPNEFASLKTAIEKCLAKVRQSMTPQALLDDLASTTRGPGSIAVRVNDGQRRSTLATNR